MYHMRELGTRGSASRAQEDGLYSKEAAEQEEELHPERTLNKGSWRSIAGTSLSKKRHNDPNSLIH